MQAVKNIAAQAGGGTDSPLRAAIQNHWLARLFGCRHRNMSPPYTGGEDTYRSCMSCGARRSFSVGRGRMTGVYYYAPVSDLYGSPLPKGPAGEKG